MSFLTDSRTFKRAEERQCEALQQLAFTILHHTMGSGQTSSILSPKVISGRFRKLLGQTCCPISDIPWTRAVQWWLRGKSLGIKNSAGFASLSQIHYFGRTLLGSDHAAAVCLHCLSYNDQIHYFRQTLFGSDHAVRLFTLPACNSMRRQPRQWNAWANYRTQRYPTSFRPGIWDVWRSRVVGPGVSSDTPNTAMSIHSWRLASLNIRRKKRNQSDGGFLW